MDTICNGLLLAASGYALYKLYPLHHPYGYMAAVLGLIHSLGGMWCTLSANKDTDCNLKNNTTNNIMNNIPLPLINIQLYLKSGNDHIALAHGIFVIPLIIDLFARFYEFEIATTTIDSAKDLTLLGNIVSLFFLAVKESNNLYSYMAAQACITIYGGALFDNYYEGRGYKIRLLGNSGFIYLLVMALEK